MHIARARSARTFRRVRLRLPELLEAKGLTPYYLAKQSGGRISLSAAYRYMRLRGKVKSFDADLLEALCDVLDVEPGELLEREPKRRGKR
jgi:DNA-binding Xre family transcriptional regulator